jgi:hypothetical protein
VLDLPPDILRLLRLLESVETPQGEPPLPVTLYLRFLAVFAKTIELLKQLNPDVEPDSNVRVLVRVHYCYAVWFRPAVESLSLLVCHSIRHRHLR